MELRHLRYFLAVAEELNFGKAAERLNISQPPLSRQIMELEAELGAKLFERPGKGGARGVALTPAGRFLRIHAAKLVDMASYVKEKIAVEGGADRRVVKIGYVGSALYSFLPELIGIFRRECPRMGFEFTELGSDDQARALAAGRIDIGFIRSRLDDPGIRFVPLAEETLSIAYAKDLEGIAEDREGVARFARLPFIAFSRSCSPVIAERSERICARAGFAPRVVFCADQYDSVLRFVAAGLGWSIVPSLALRNSRYELASLELIDLPEGIAIGVAVRSGETDPLIESLIALSRGHFAG